MIELLLEGLCLCAGRDRLASILLFSNSSVATRNSSAFSVLITCASSASSARALEAIPPTNGASIKRAMVQIVKDGPFKARPPFLRS